MKESWVPDAVSTPVKILHVNFHIWQRSDGTGNLDDTPANRARLEQVGIWVSDKYQYNYPSTWPLPYPVDYIADSRIRVVLDSIYFYPDPSIDSSYYISNSPSHNSYLDAYLALNHPERLHALPLHLAKKGPWWINHPQWSTAAGYANNGSIESFYRYAPDMNTSPAHDYWYSAHLAHEIGHGFDLWHTYDHGFGQTCSMSQPDYLWDVFDSTLNCVLIPIVPANNNLMGGGDNFHHSRLQCALAQRSISLGNFPSGNFGMRDYVVGYSQIPWEVTTDQTWDFSMKMYQDLVVKPGATLTVQCELQFVPEAGIIIEPGGRLIVDGGKLTNEAYFDGFWKGISVWGNSAEHQFPEEHPTHQGIIILNDATIENAREAISLWGDGWDTFGGVVRATNTVFRNCRRSAQFMAYQNFTSTGAPHRNNSYFTGCTFTVDDAYRGNEDFYAHVSLWGVDGITFEACAFENLSTTTFESHKRGHGIISLDASYTVDGVCAVMPPDGSFCHENDLTRSRFTGHDHGINARNATTARGFIVRGALFEDNICGVYAQGVTGFQVTNNIIDIGGSVATILTGEIDEAFEERHRAVFSTNSWGFAIDDNVLNQRGDHAETEGIVVGYSRDHNDLVFRNTASGLERAYIGEGICADLDETYAMLRGLQFICNGNDGNAQNFWSRKVDADEIENPLTHTIRTNQGDFYRPADNTFDQVPGPEGGADYEVTTQNGNIAYWHRNSGAFIPLHVRQSVDPPCYLGPSVTTQIPPNHCASKVLATIPYDEDHESGMLLQPIADHLLAEKLAYGNTRYLFEELIDGGSTDEVVGEIAAAWPQDAWDLRDYLLSLSPYLSVAALKEAMDKEWFPDAMRAQICIANPDATKKEGFLDWLRNECLYPLPEYMLASIVASWESQTYRTALEAEMAHHHAEMSQAANLLLHRHHWDEDGAQAHELREVWQKLRTPAARYAEALTWLQEGNYALADAVIRDIPDEHDLKAPEMLERGRMRDFIALLLAAHADGRSEAELNTGEVEALQGLIAGANDRPATWISNLLCFHYQICRSPLTSGITGGPKSRIGTQTSTSAERFGGMLFVHPNPANTWAAFDYDLLSEPIEAAILIRDALGREVQRKELLDSRQQIVMDARQLAPGSYTVVLINNGRRLRAEKLIISQ